jgi:hypothetical protein
MMQPVKRPESWPEMQRYDYLVRRKVLSDDEAKIVIKKQAFATLSYRTAVQSALQHLTGIDGPTTAAEWKVALEKKAVARAKERP